MNSKLFPDIHKKPLPSRSEENWKKWYSSAGLCICIYSTYKKNDSDNKIKVLDWSSKSPALNILEKVWDVLVYCVCANGGQFNMKDELKLVILLAW